MASGRVSDMSQKPPDCLGRATTGAGPHLYVCWGRSLKTANWVYTSAGGPRQSLEVVRTVRFLLLKLASKIRADVRPWKSNTRRRGHDGLCVFGGVQVVHAIRQGLRNMIRRGRATTRNHRVVIPHGTTTRHTCLVRAREREVPVWLPNRMAGSTARQSPSHTSCYFVNLEKPIYLHVAT